MKRGLTILAVAVAGCGSGVGTLPSSSLPALKPGTYVGTTTCQWTESWSGIVVDQGGGPVSSTLVIGDSGLPIVTVGEILVTTAGNLEIRSEVTDLITTGNGAVVSLQATIQLDCGNTCQFAFDGVCDEVQFCALATDCSDCGPLVLTGPETVTYQVVDENRIRRTLSLIVREEDAGLVDFVNQCEGILSR
jgi:hypothetical protein